jgi:hypothetical protein
MRIGKGNHSTRRKSTPVPLYPPRIPSWPDMGSSPGRSGGKQRLTAWAMARPQ